MDTVVPKKRGKLALKIGAGVLAVLLGAGAVWYFVPHGLQVEQRDVRIATVTRGIFNDDIVVRATAEPLNSFILDSIESGRVEEVVVKDGAMVRKGDLLFRMSNTQRNLDLLQRQGERAQQISNLQNLRVAQEASRTDHERRLDDLVFARDQARKAYERNLKLSSQGFISSVALEESHDKLAQAERAVETERKSADLEKRVQHEALVQMDTAIAGLERGLRIVTATVDALAFRAPADGKLTGFRLKVGETVRPDQHIGRIDDPSAFKLTADVDEFYLNRVSVGRHGRVTAQDGKAYDVDVSTIYPQIKDGRFTMEMIFTHGQPQGLNPGQSMDAQVTLGQPAQALLLPNAAFVNDTGGSWVFVLDRRGHAEKRPVRIGRRSNSQIEVLSGLNAGDKVIVSSYAQFGKAETLQLSN
ncbi:efflux RND transporter periplasmic adaptor subunit [Massilia arenosa]|uniref:Efflux RND transporter periplasmic adaptor subunit n=2 Tax=Zemynaea arenosa TaxID=2561931 RepID=A0A4Y9SXF0_9BURK|nr:efflux RND transporter periplasmic adaptor subunit [Massilia arenosa]